MGDDTTARLIYLGLLGAVIGGYFLVANRHNLGRMAQQASIWGLIFVGVAAGYGLWADIRSDIRPQQAVFSAPGETRIEVPRAQDGHYYLTLQIAGTPVTFIVDTGASDVVLSREDAERLGLDPGNLAYLGRAGTANGTVHTARVTLSDVRLGAIHDPRLTAWVSQGEMPGSLLGMAYLQRFTRIEIAGDRLLLSR
ncbi:MAG: TIGR02281 family clan AA aspartic protease [Rhodobacteraceae bacterium]|nr:TIGR02281 family clan AA aspartic protease [Paracoccaceae bacterium]